MDTYRLKLDAKEFAFKNKGLIWRALWLIILIGLVGGFAVGFFNVIDKTMGDFVNSLVSVFSLFLEMMYIFSAWVAMKISWDTKN